MRDSDPSSIVLFSPFKLIKTFWCKFLVWIHHINTNEMNRIFERWHIYFVYAYRCLVSSPAYLIFAHVCFVSVHICLVSVHFVLSLHWKRVHLVFCEVVLSPRSVIAFEHWVSLGHKCMIPMLSNSLLWHWYLLSFWAYYFKTKWAEKIKNRALWDHSTIFYFESHISPSDPNVYFLH